MLALYSNIFSPMSTEDTTTDIIPVFIHTKTV